MNGKTSSGPIVVLALLALLLLAACGGGDDEGSNGGGASASLADLLGSYERTVTKADIARNADKIVKEEGFESSPPGPHRLVIEDDVFRTISLSDNFAIAQYLTASGDGNFDIGNYVNPGKGAFCGPKVPQGAIYSWTLEGDVLTLEAESESCADRDSVLSGEWTRTADQ